LLRENVRHRAARPHPALFDAKYGPAAGQQFRRYQTILGQRPPIPQKPETIPRDFATRSRSSAVISAGIQLTTILRMIPVESNQFPEFPGVGDKFIVPNSAFLIDSRGRHRLDWIGGQDGERDAASGVDR